VPRAPKFSDKNIKAEAAPGKRLFIRDTPNLYLWTSSGPRRRQRWIFRFSRPDGRGVTERSLGRYPEVPLEMARNRANHMRMILARDKKDPWEMGEDEGATLKYGEVARRWVDSRDWTNREKQRHDTEYFLFTCAKKLLQKPLLKIRPKDVHDALRTLWNKRPKQAKRTLTKIEAVFDFAKANHWYFAENPARWREKQKYLFPRFSNDRVNHPALPYESMPEFMLALRQHQGNSVAAIALEFVIITTTSSSAVRGMKWSELSLENRIWTIPKERMSKRGSREHIVPLCPRAIEIINRRKEHTISDYVFSAHGRNKPLDEKAMREILRKIKPGVTVHGFRSTFRDWAGDETDFPRDLIEECLGHSVGNAVERAYRRRSSLEKRREIMQAWASFCEGNSPIIPGT
jgi:integrase